MIRRVIGFVLMIGLVIAVSIVQTAQIQSTRKSSAQQDDGYYLAGNFDVREGVFETREGRRGTGMFGTIGFRVASGDKETLQIQLLTLNLISEGLKLEQGETGVIGLSLAEAGSELDYNPRTGEFRGSVEGFLHYELIDRIKGYKPQECKGECDRFESYVEVVKGEVVGRFQEPLQPAPEGKARLELEVNYELAEEVLGVIHRVYAVIVVIIDWSLFQSSDVLRIQPVFVGSGPSDPTATGTAFNTLMNYSHDMWNRCASERCIKFVVNDPIYVNNNAYRVLDSESEAIAFKGTVNVANAVEVFVAERMSTSLACSWGGGACFSGGTASSKVVSCDQQMAVPSPCPAPCTSYCPCGTCLSGAINPYHLAHELGHAFNLPHPAGSWSTSTVTSIMEPSGFCCDNPNLQSAKNCRNASNPLMFSSLSICSGSPDIND
ncbi:hypothetical protein ACFLS5_01525 [Candidatus Bipolaricaulota bacterium]